MKRKNKMARIEIISAFVVLTLVVAFFVSVIDSHYEKNVEKCINNGNTEEYCREGLK